MWISTSFAVSEFGEPSNSAFLAGIHKDQASDPIKVHVFQLGEVEEVGGGMEKEIPQIFFLGPGKHQRSARIKFLGCNHGGESIEIGIHVSRDDLFMHLLRSRMLQILFRPKGCHCCIIAQMFGMT